MIPIVVDLYHGDTVSSFKLAAAQGIRGVIHKASQGTTVTDELYDVRRDKAKAAGLLWGAYHFATDEDPAAQVKHFLSCAEPDKDTLVALDYEPNGNHTMSFAGALAFLRGIESALGRKAVLYSGNLIKEQSPSDLDAAYLAQHRLWLAEYGPVARLPAAWTKYWLWQFTGDGIGPGPHAIPGIPGAGGALDLNTYAGTLDQFATEWAS